MQFVLFPILPWLPGGSEPIVEHNLNGSKISIHFPSDLSFLLCSLLLLFFFLKKINFIVSSPFSLEKREEEKQPHSCIIRLDVSVSTCLLIYPYGVYLPHPGSIFIHTCEQLRQSLRSGCNNQHRGCR